MAAENEIVNRVANSSLMTLDLEALYPKGPRITVDISQWLEEGLVLREQAFRDALSTFDWSKYRGAYVHLLCTTDAIVPAWAYLLISSYLLPVSNKVVVGDRTLLETVLFQEALEAVDPEEYRDKPVIIKGCSKIEVPESAYVWALERIRGTARSIQFGEACSSVPIHRRKPGS